MTTNSPLKRVLTWIDDHILIVLSSFLLAFIPLYPKIPLRKLVVENVTNPELLKILLPLTGIEEYIVRVRLEDIFILLAAVVLGIQLLRKKVNLKSSMLWMVIAYAIVGLVSTLVVIFVIKTVPLQPLHVGKTVLHYFRYLEYFSLFMILYAAVKRRSDLILGVSIFALTVFAISAYGYGQRYFYWPVYSTMDREASKGIAQVLTEYARVQSTFGGHYDMAAYLVIALPLLLALAYKVKNRLLSLGLHITFWIGTWLLLLSASRAPYAAYMVGVLLVLAITTLTKPTWKERILIGAQRLFVFGIMSSILIFYFGQDMAVRLERLVTRQSIVNALIANLNTTRRQFISDEALADHPLSQKRVLAMLPRGNPPPVIQTPQVQQAVSDSADVASPMDQRPVPLVPVQPSPSPNIVPPDATNDNIPEEIIIEKVSPTGEITYETVKRPRTYSKCSIDKELSLCIRLEVLWPRAIEGFLTNPLTGTGYATLTKENVNELTFADSTDNNFLRTLGETGILGFIIFYGCVGLVLFAAVRHLNDKDPLVSGYAAGLLGGTIGLLLNAVYIDVFAASKVAQTYWALAGLFLGYLAVRKDMSDKVHQLAVVSDTKAPVTKTETLTPATSVRPVKTAKTKHAKPTTKTKKTTKQ